jgi:hypothetical protein
VALAPCLTTCFNGGLILDEERGRFGFIFFVISDFLSDFEKVEPPFFISGKL